jgi:aspartate dehydrogenase
MRIALIGCGTLGSYIARAVHKGVAGDHQMVSVLNTPRSDGAGKLARELGCAAAADIDSLLQPSPDLVVEAATREAVWEFGEECVRKGSSLIVLSSGAMLDAEFRSRLVAVARQAGRKIYLPSGALGGLDLARAAQLGGNLQASLTTRKPPRALDMDAVELTDFQEVFSGSAVDGIARFPKNVNVAASASLATSGPEALGLTLTADPSLDSNVHRLELKGDFGEATVEIRARPMPHNPKSSALAALSVLALLSRISSPLEIGG